ncbi:MAG TPA: hypothetical protein VHH72_03545 [Solirubrobacterales bacterium]|nr:hypothetical protein [Solirubrobacterales bacterium]
MATVGGAGLALAAAPSSPTPIPPGPVVTASVSCGGDHSRALAGGFLAPDFSIESGRTTVRTKLKRTGRHTWEVGAAALGQETGSILPVGYCTKLRGTQITAAASATVPANEIGTATATCPAGSRAVSGGFESPGFDLTSGHVLPLTSMRVGDKSWQVTGVNPDFGAGVSPAQLIAYAYCLKGKPPITTVSVDVLVVGEGFTPADVNCPSGTRALSGGFDGHPVIDQSGFNAAGSVESYRLSGRTGWRTNAVQAGEQPSTVTTYAYCEPKPPVPPK